MRRLALALSVFGTACLGGSQALLSQGVPPDQRQALLAIYEATDGSHWKKHDGWLGGPGTECKWYGVWCEGGADQLRPVIGLDLGQNDLKGNIPQEIARLKQLESLTLFGNRLSGRLPDALIERWLDGSLNITAEAPLLTDVSEIDFESSPSALLCGQQRVVLRSDTTAVEFTNRCRNATPGDRTTYCEVKQGRIIWGSFARLAWSLERNAFFTMLPKYERNSTEGTFVSIRVTRDERAREVVDYDRGGPLRLWTIESAIEGVASEIDWEKTRTDSKCPAWRTIIRP
jgi:hypothetical protein